MNAHLIFSATTIPPHILVNYQTFYSLWASNDRSTFTRLYYTLLRLKYFFSFETFNGAETLLITKSQNTRDKCKIRYELEQFRLKTLVGNK